VRTFLAVLPLGIKLIIGIGIVAVAAIIILIACWISEGMDDDASEHDNESEMRHWND
jgi:hypothetical protein